MAVRVEEVGVPRLREVELFGLVVLVAGVTEEHELAVVFPLGEVEVF